MKILTDVSQTLEIESCEIIKASKTKFAQNYEFNAVIPNGKWKKVSLDIIDNNFEKFHLGKNIFISKLSDENLTKINSLNLINLKTREEVFYTIQNEIETLSKLNEEINNLTTNGILKHSENISFHKISILKGGEQTINYKIFEQSKLFTGLHIDISEINHFGEFYKSKQRLCINLGEPRFIIFTPITIDEVYKEVHKITNLNYDNFMNIYYEHFQHLPIYRIKIPFGFYYISPTDNVVHDGSNINHNGFDITLHYLGNFKL